jgi:hypothetical protein
MGQHIDRRQLTRWLESALKDSNISCKIDYLITFDQESSETQAFRAVLPADRSGFTKTSAEQLADGAIAYFLEKSRAQDSGVEVVEKKPDRLVGEAVKRTLGGSVYDTTVDRAGAYSWQGADIYD